MKSRHVTWPVLCTLGAAAIVAACGGGSDSDTGTGTLRLSLTDTPACGYDNVFVTVEKVRVHRSSAAGANDGGWEEMAVSPALQVDLLTLTNGTLEPLGQMQLPAGTYTQMRLLLAANGNSAPWANYIVPTGGSATPLTTPSAQQSGLKMNVNLTVNPDTVADFAIDFDACKSFVKAGKSGKYLLKPVLSVIPIISSKIVGWVDAPMIPASGVATSVSAQVNGVPLRATAPDATGQFTLAWLPTGNYDVVITSTGRVNAVMTGVPVSATTSTVIGSDAVRINTPSSASFAASGAITPVGNGGAVRATQTLTAGPTIEVAYVNADALSGNYSLTLPSAAPAKVPYAAGATTFTFTDTAADAGKYKLEASATVGTTVVTKPALDITPATPVNNFAF
jgi:Domain of unknown function (DUF4382)